LKLKRRVRRREEPFEVEEELGPRGEPFEVEEEVEEEE
jgi:hypothetical protein